MFCWNCGTQIPDESAFCAKCGKPQGQPSQVAGPRQTPQIWETCEIEIDQRNDLLNGAIYWFIARAIGPKLQYTAGKTPELLVGSRFMSYPKSNDKKASVAHQALVDYLIANGWQVLPDKGTNWWSYRFRRQIDPDWEECEIEARVLKRGITSAEFKFIAVVTKGPKGKYDGEESPLIVIKGKDRLDPDQSKTTPLVMDAFRNFMEKLQRAGWKSTSDLGKYWWNQRLRRPAKEGRPIQRGAEIMFCPSCGTQLPEDANFCWKCGKSQKGAATTPNEAQYEHCRIELVEIGYRFLQGTFYQFDANAIGPNGPYVAGHSKQFSDLMNENQQPAILNTLIRQLVADGWEAVETKGTKWYQHSFRRRV